MSAFVVDSIHLDVILAGCLHGPSDSSGWEGVRWSAGDEERRLTVLNVDRLGRALFEENVASVCWLVASDTADDYSRELEYLFSEPGYTPSCAELAKALRAYRYQACEHPGFGLSEAAAFVEAALLTILYSLPGDEAAPWEWDEQALQARIDAQRQARLTNRQGAATLARSRVETEEATK